MENFGFFVAELKEKWSVLRFFDQISMVSAPPSILRSFPNRTTRPRLKKNCRFTPALHPMHFEKKDDKMCFLRRELCAVGQ